MPRNELDLSARSYPATRVRFAGAGDHVTRPLPVETPVNIVYAPTPHAVMMASPADLEDFAVGFSFTEGIIERLDDIRSIEIEAEPRGIRVIVSLSADKLRVHLARKRNMAGRTGCGVCGIDDLDALPFAAARARRGPPLSLAAARKALADLEGRQPLNDLTHAVHAGAWCGHGGDILHIREDVGRHNALDKLIGALLRAKVDPASGFVVITSRCSFEMVEKTAAFGARALVAVSAPTSLAIERAEAHGMTLLAVARADGALVFTDHDGVVDDLSPREARRA